MKIKEEPIDLDYESSISKSSNILCTLHQSSTDVGCVKLDSTTIDNDSEHQLILNAETVNGGLQSNNHVTAQLPTQIPTVGTNVQQGSSSLPACETWLGDYDFTVSFRPQQKSTKGVAWTYSKIKDKLYVGKDVPCPINFSANTLLPNDVCIRVMALYTQPEQVSEKVERCINHSKEEIQNGLVEAQHLIRCESSTATYHSDIITGRHSVVVPFENPPAGQEYSTYIYKFACFTSCPGGPNRRPLMLIFTLERGNQVIGRKKLDVKICACPGRDRKTDEAPYLEPEAPNQCTIVAAKRKVNDELVNLSTIMDFTKNVYIPPPKKIKVHPNKDGAYTIRTDDKDCYEFLLQMKKLFEMCNTIRSVTPDVLLRVLHHAQKFKSEKNE